MAPAVENVVVRSVYVPCGYAAEMSASARESEHSTIRGCASKFAFINTDEDCGYASAPEYACSFPDLIEIRQHYFRSGFA
jgi:hypothetical protein